MLTAHPHEGVSGRKAQTSVACQRACRHPPAKMHVASALLRLISVRLDLLIWVDAVGRGRWKKHGIAMTCVWRWASQHRLATTITASPTAATRCFATTRPRREMRPLEALPERVYPAFAGMSLPPSIPRLRRRERHTDGLREDRDGQA